MRWKAILAGAALAAGLAAQGAAAPRSAPPLTPYGWGAIRIGMPEAEAKRRFGMVSTAADGDCHQIEFPAHPDLTGMARGGRVARLDIGGESRLRTDRGLGIGSTELQVRRAYGPRLEVTPDDYQDRPAHYLTYWERPGVRGVMYVTDPKGVVIAVYVGDETIGWTDGCG
jgi:hypothetical protein